MTCSLAVGARWKEPHRIKGLHMDPYKEMLKKSFRKRAHQPNRGLFFSVVLSFSIRSPLEKYFFCSPIDLDIKSPPEKDNTLFRRFFYLLTGKKHQGKQLVLDALLIPLPCWCAQAKAHRQYTHTTLSSWQAAPNRETVRPIHTAEASVHRSRGIQPPVPA